MAENTELPSDDGSEAGLLERLGNVLVSDAGAPGGQVKKSAAEASEDDEPTVEHAETEENAEELADESATSDESASEGEELVEIETESGKKFRVPQELKNEFMHKADYTRKTQEISALQRQTHAVLQQQQLVSQFQQETADEQRQLSGVQAEIDRYKAIDWTQLDTETYIKARGQLDMLRDKAGDLEKAIQKKAALFEQKMHGNRAQAAAAAYEYIGKHVKGFAPDSAIEKELANYAANNGIPVEAFVNVALALPQAAVAMWKAMKFDQLQASKATAVKKVQKAPPVLKPGAVASTGSAQQAKSKELRQALRKTGDVRVAAKLFEQFM